MATACWNATVIDSPGSDPFAILGELVVAVRTPRSRDFVTVEVTPMALCASALERPAGVLVCHEPPPFLTHQWHGELNLGATVGFNFAERSYRLTLARLAEIPEGSPWVTCDFCLESD